MQCGTDIIYLNTPSQGSGIGKCSSRNRCNVKELWHLATTQCDSNLGVILRGKMHVNIIGNISSLHNKHSLYHIYCKHHTVRGISGADTRITLCVERNLLEIGVRLWMSGLDPVLPHWQYQVCRHTEIICLTKHSVYLLSIIV